MFRPTDNTQIDTIASWNSLNPIVPYGVIAVAVDTYQMKVGDGSSHWADLNFVGSTTLSSKLIQNNRAPQNNEIIIYESYHDSWMYRIQGIVNTAENWESINDVYPTFAILIETDNTTFKPTSRVKISDGTTPQHEIPWITPFDLSSFPTGYSIEFNGTEFEPASYLPMYACPESATPTGTKFARDDGTWSDLADTYITGETTVVNENIVIYDGTTGHQVKDSGISVNDLLLDDGTQDNNFKININTGPSLVNVSGELHIKTNDESDYANARVKSIYGEFGTFDEVIIGGFPTEPTSVSLTSDGTYLYVDGSKLITLHNDGHGCGFDADTIDGYHSSQFATPGDFGEFATSGDIEVSTSKALIYSLIFR